MSNPISFKQLFDFNDFSSSNAEQVQGWLTELTANYKTLIDTVANNGLANLTAQQKEIADSVRLLVEQTQNLNQSNKEGQQLLINSAQNMQTYRTAMEGFNTAQTQTIKLSREAKDVVDILQRSMANYSKELNSLTGQEADYLQRKQRLTAEITKAGEELKKFGVGLQNAAGQTQELVDSNVALREVLASLVLKRDQLSSSTKANDAATIKELGTINELIILLENEKLAVTGALTANKALNDIKNDAIATASKIAVVQSEENKTLLENQILLKQKNDLIAVGIKTEEEYIAAQADLGAQQQRLNGLIKEGIAIRTGEYEAQLLKVAQAEDQLLMKQMAIGESRAAAMDADIIKEREKTENQIYQGERRARAIDEENEKMVASVVKRNLQIAALEIEAFNKETEQLEKLSIAHDKIASKELADNEKRALSEEKLAIRQQAAIEKTSIAYKLQTFVVRDLFRLLAGFFTIIPIMAAITAITEAAKALIEELKQLTLWEKTASEYLNDFVKAQNSAAETAGQEKAKMETLYATAINLNIAYKDRVLAVKKLQDLYPDYFGNLKMEDILAGKAAASYEKLTEAIEKSAKAKGIENLLADVETKLIIKKDRLDKLLGRSPDQLRLDGDPLKDNTFYEPNKNEVVELQNQIEYLESKRKTLLAGIDAPDMADRKVKKGHKGRDPMPRELQDEEQYHKDINSKQKGSFDVSNRSFDDRKDLYQEEDEEAQRHFNSQKAIIDKYTKIYGEKDERIKIAREKAQVALDEETRKNAEARQKDLDDMHEYEDRKIRLIEDTNRKIEKNNDEAQRHLDQFKANAAKQKQQHASDSNPNLVGAFFGTDGSRSLHDFKDDIKQRDIDIALDRKNLNASSTAGIAAASRVTATGLKVSENAKIPDSQKTPLQLKEQQTDLEENAKAIDAKKQADEKYAVDYEKLQKDLGDKQRKIDLRDKDAKIAVAKQTFNTIDTIANSAFDAQRKRIQAQMADTQALATFEMTIAGNNSAAKIRIAQQEHAKMLALKREEAKIEKEQGIFSAIVSTAKGVAAALAVDPPLGFVLAALVAAAGLVQVANISSAPLPSYAKGRSGGKAEYARVNEEGYEIIERNDKYLIAGTGKETITTLQAGDKVHTHEQSVKMLETNTSAKNWMNNLLAGTGAYVKIEDENKRELHRTLTQNFVSKADFQEVMDRAISKMPAPVFQAPAKGVEDRLQRIQRRNGLGD